MAKYGNGNLAVLVRMPGDVTNIVLGLDERSTADGSLISSTYPGFDNTTSGVRAFTGLASTSDGFMFSENLYGTIEYGGTTITSSANNDMIIVRYTNPAPPITSHGAITREIIPASLVVYPDPASDQLTIRNNNGKKLGLISIYDASGKMVHQEFVGELQKTIDIAKFSSGLFYIQSAGSSAIKFLKK